MGFIAFLLAYLIGNFSSAYVIGKVFYGIDIRTKGSLNAGATNSTRICGKKAGLATLFLDMFKAFVAVYLVRLIEGEEFLPLAILGVVLGHIYPIVLAFKGGKGVATSAAALIIVDYRLFILGVLVFIVTVLISNYISLASILSSFAVMVAVFIYHQKFGNLMSLVLVFISLLVIFKHHSNIKRLINKEEMKFRSK